MAREKKAVAPLIKERLQHRQANVAPRPWPGAALTLTLTQFQKFLVNVSLAYVLVLVNAGLKRLCQIEAIDAKLCVD